MLMILITVAIAAFHLIQLHGPGGQEIDVNPHEISSLRDPSSDPEGHFAKGIRCIVFMTNGKALGITEDCDTVRKIVEEELNEHGN